MRRRARTRRGLGYTLRARAAPRRRSPRHWLARAGRRRATSPACTISKPRSRRCRSPCSTSPADTAATLDEHRRPHRRRVASRLPRDGLARRFGPQLAGYTRPRARRAGPIRARPSCRRRAFAAGSSCPRRVAEAQALLFAAQAARSREFAGFSRRGTGRGVQRFALRTQRTTTAADARDVGLVDADAAMPRISSLVLRERFERLALAARPVEASRSTADELRRSRQKTSRFFPSAAHAPEEQRAAGRAPARAAGRGGGARPRLVPEHRPERAWRASAPAAAQARRRSTRPRPLWLLAEPRPLRSATRAAPRRPARAARRTASASRAAGGTAATSQRDYFVARDADGARYWVYRERRGRPLVCCTALFG